MKSITVALFFIAGAFPVLGAAETSVKSFGEILNEDERSRIIDSASPEQKPDFIKVDHHLRLLKQWGEAGIVTKRKAAAATARGLAYLTGLIALKSDVWLLYIGATYHLNMSSMPPAQASQIAEKQEKELKAIDRQEPAVIDLVFNLAASPEALALNANAKALDDKISRLIQHSGRYPPVTELQRMEVDKEVNTLLDQLPKLPKLTPEQAQREFDALTEDKLRAPKLD